MCREMLLKLSAKDAEVVADQTIDPWSNIKMKLTGSNGEVIPEDLYAKVMGSLAQDGAGFTVHFTSIPPTITTYIERLLASCSATNA